VKTTIKLLIFIFLISLTQISLAAWTGNQQVKVLKAQGNGIYLMLDGFVNNDPEIACGSNDFFLLNTSNGYKERVSFLLSAYMSGKSVNVSYYGCSSGHIEIGSVQLQ